MSNSLARQVARRQVKETLRTQITELTHTVTELKHTVELKDAQLLYAEKQRDEAQAGVLPYVQAVEAFNEWVAEQPEAVRVAIQAALGRFGLLGVRVGFTPPHQRNWFEAAATEPNDHNG